MERFGVDTIEMGRGFLLKESEWKKWELPEGSPCLIPFYIHVEKRDEDWILRNENGLELGIQKKGCLFYLSGEPGLGWVGLTASTSLQPVRRRILRLHKPLLRRYHNLNS